MKFIKILLVLIFSAGIAYSAVNWEKLEGCECPNLGIYSIYLDRKSCVFDNNKCCYTVKTCYAKGYYEISRITITEKNGSFNKINKSDEAVPVMTVTNRKLYNQSGFVKNLTDNKVEIDTNNLDEDRYNMLNNLVYFMVGI